MKGFALCRAGRAHRVESNAGRSPTLGGVQHWCLAPDGAGAALLVEKWCKQTAAVAAAEAKCLIPWVNSGYCSSIASAPCRLHDSPPSVHRALIDWRKRDARGLFWQRRRRWRASMFWPLGVDSGASTSGCACDGISFVWLVSAALINWWLDLHNLVWVTQFFWSGTDRICCSSTSAGASGRDETPPCRFHKRRNSTVWFHLFVTKTSATFSFFPPSNHQTRDLNWIHSHLR